MTGPTRAGDKSTGPRYRGHPTLMGDGFASEHGLVEKDLSRGEAPICCNDPLFHGCLRRRSLSNSNFRRPLRHHRANHVHHSAAHSGRLNLALSELSSYCSLIVKSSGFCESARCRPASPSKVDRADEAALRCRKPTEKSKMAAKKAGLKKVRREEWRVQLEKLAKENPLVPHTDAGRTFSMVRRMKAEKKMGIPITLRSGFAISTENGKAANAMSEEEWEEFYDALSKHLRRNYPGLYARLFWTQ